MSVEIPSLAAKVRSINAGGHVVGLDLCLHPRLEGDGERVNRVRKPMQVVGAELRCHGSFLVEVDESHKVQ